MEKRCILSKIGVRTENSVTESYIECQPQGFDDIPDLHRMLFFFARNQKLQQNTLLVAYDRQENIISTIRYKETNSLGDYFSQHVITHSGVWEKAIDNSYKKPNEPEIPSFDIKIEANLKKTISESYKNGCDLLSDAELLFDNQRYSRANALSILAFEEFAKALILTGAVQEEKWNSEIFSMLRNHAYKHASLFVAIIYMQSIYRQSRTTLFTSPFAIPTSKLEKAIKRYGKSQYLDKLKQSMQFTDIQKDGRVTKVPSNKKDASLGLYLAKKAFYLLSYYTEQKHEDIFEAILASEFSSSTHEIFPNEAMKLLEKKHRLYFGDGCYCDVSGFISLEAKDLSTAELFGIASENKNSLDEKINTFFEPIIDNAHATFEGRQQKEYSEEVRTFWKVNNEIYDYAKTFEEELKRTGYRYSPYFAAIEKAYK